MILGTGIRTGEVFAIRWIDLDLDREDPRVLITGTARQQPGLGLIRQEHPKSEQSNRSLILPPFVVSMLRARQTTSASDYVFDSAAGTMRSPNNFRTQWRTFRKAHRYEDWVVPKTFRKAVATIVKNKSGIDLAASQLGHSSTTVTRKHYVQDLHEGPDVRSILEEFATGSSVYPAN
jgi:integrase